MKPTFSIIVVCFNAGDKLKNTIESIREQTYGTYEIIVKDGGSTDGSLQMIPEDSKIRVISCKDAGIYDAMNQAVRQTKGDYVLFLNCGDSFYSKTVLEETAEKIGNEKEPALIYYGDTYNETEKTTVVMNARITPFTCYRHIPCHQACFYAKELFMERQYDISYVVRADYEHFLWSYFCKHAAPQHLKLIVANYEGGGFSETKENHKRDLEEHKAITKRYMTTKQLIGYRMIMILTLVSVRRYLSKQKYFSGIYNGVKRLVYRS